MAERETELIQVAEVRAETAPVAGQPLQRLGVLYHPKLPATRPVAEEIVAALQSAAFGQRDAWISTTWDEEAIQRQIPGSDAFIVLGGDGSVLRAARLAAPHGILIIGLNMGRLGFLSEMRPENWRERLPRLVSGDYWVEERMMLRADAFRGETRLVQKEALNDVVVSRGSLARMVRLHTHIDGGYLTTYNADGLIVSTATGSTAYALAVGGPILPPQLKNMLLIPIAPHLSLDRAIVLDQGARVEIIVETDHRAIITVDGQYELGLHDRDRVIVEASPYVSRFARVQTPDYFYRTLMERLDPGRRRGD